MAWLMNRTTDSTLKEAFQETAVANQGRGQAMRDHHRLRNGLNVDQCRVLFREAAEATGHEFAAS